MVRHFFLLSITGGYLLVLSATARAADTTPYPLDALTRAHCETLLLERNRDLRAMRTTLEAVKADAAIAGERPNPTLSVNTTGINQAKGIGGGGLWDKRMDTVIRVDQQLERGNKRALRLAAADTLIQAQSEDGRDLLRQLREVLADSYSDLTLAQERERIVAETVALYRRTVQASTLRLEAGDIAPADLARIQVDAARAEADLRQTQADRVHAQLALAALLGIETQTTLIRAVDPWPAPIAPSAIGEGVAALEQRPDVHAAMLRVQAAEKARDLARAQQTRDVSVGIQYEHFPPDGRNLIGIGFSAPLFLSHQFQGEIARAEADLQAARDNADRVYAQAMMALQKARTDVLAAIERRERFESGITDAARRAADAAEFAFQHGATGVTDLLDARRTLRATLLDATAAEADYAKALAAWKSALNTEE